MTLIATPGAVDANSFCTVGEALLAHIGRTGADAWASAAPEVQEASLIEATTLLSLRLTWLAAPVDPETQALPLPMVGQADAMGRALAEDIIPPLVVQATALYALALFQERRQTTQAAQGIQRVNVHGDVDITYRDMPMVSVSNRLPQELWAYLRYYGTMPGLGRRLAVVRG